jgi:hypothetical protein
MVESRCAIAITVLALHQRRELVLDRELDLAVERRRGLVEDQDGSVFQDDARQGDALALAARELDAALADVRLVAGALLPVDQVDDELVRLRLPRRRLDLGRRAARPAVGDVGGDRAVQSDVSCVTMPIAGAQALLRSRARCRGRRCGSIPARPRGSAAAG